MFTSRYCRCTGLRLAVICLFAISLTPPAFAESARERRLEAEVDGLRDDIDMLRADLVLLHEEIRALEYDIESANRDIISLKSELTQVAPRLAEAQQEEAKARQAVDKAQAKVEATANALKRTKHDIRQQLEQSPTMRRAYKELKEARELSDAARETVLNQLKASASYQQALGHVKEARQKLTEVRETEGATPIMIAEAAQAVLDHQKQVTALEHQALAADEPYKEARLKLDATTVALAQIKDELEEAAKRHPEIIAAKKAQVDAEAAVQPVVNRHKQKAVALAAVRSQVSTITDEIQRLQHLIVFKSNLIEYKESLRARKAYVKLYKERAKARTVRELARERRRSD